ncbi:MAG: hypothetical protein EBX40_07450, partial [Gammaproteobacteria bacterium]|nr:hypothetical protein [Gammaproteobacteria bacterium]
IRNISLIAAKQGFFTKRDCSPSPGVEAAGVFGIVLIFLVPFMLCALRERCKRSSRAHDQVSNSDLAEPLMTGESMDPAQESQEIQSSRCEGIVKKLKSAVSTPVLNLSRMCCQRLSSEKAVGPEDDTYLAEGL